MQQGLALLWLGQPLALLSQSLQVLGGLKIDTMPLTNQQSFYGDTLVFMLVKKKKEKENMRLAALSFPMPQYVL